MKKTKNLRDLGKSDLKNLQIKQFNYEDEKTFGNKDYIGIFKNGKIVEKDFTPDIIKAIQDLETKVENNKSPFEINFNLVSVPQKNLQIGEFMVADPLYSDIKGPLRISPTGFEPLYADKSQLSNLKPLPKKNLKQIKPVIFDGKPMFIAQNVEKVCPEAVYVYKGLKCVNTDVLLAYLFANL